MTFPILFDAQPYVGSIDRHDSDVGRWNPRVSATNGETPTVVNNPNTSAYPAKVLRCRSTAAGGTSRYGGAFRHILNGESYGGASFALGEVHMAFTARFHADDAPTATTEFEIFFRLFEGASTNRVVFSLTSPGASGADTRLRYQVVGQGGAVITTTGINFNTDYRFRVYWKAASGAGSDGALRIWVDDVEVSHSHTAHASTSTIASWDVCADSVGLADNTTAWFSDIAATRTLAEVPTNDRFNGAFRFGDAKHDTQAVIVRMHQDYYGVSDLYVKVQWWTGSPIVPVDPTENETDYVYLDPLFDGNHADPLRMTGLEPGVDYYCRLVFAESDDPEMDLDESPVYGPVQTPPAPGAPAVVELWSTMCRDSRPGSRPYFADRIIATTARKGALILSKGDKTYKDDKEQSQPYDGTALATCEGRRNAFICPLSQDMLRRFAEYDIVSDHLRDNNGYGAEWKGNNNPTPVGPNDRAWVNGPGGSAMTRHEVWVAASDAYEVMEYKHFLNQAQGSPYNTRHIDVGNTRIVFTDTREDRDSRNGTETMMGSATRDEVKALIDNCTLPHIVIVTDPPMFDVGTDADNWESSITGSPAPAAWTAERDAYILDPIEANDNIRHGFVMSGDRHCAVLHSRMRDRWPKVKFEFWAGPIRRASILQTIIDAFPTENVHLATTNGVDGQEWVSMVGRMILDEINETVRYTVWDARYPEFEPVDFDDDEPGYPDRVLFDQTFSLRSGGGNVAGRMMMGMM